MLPNSTFLCCFFVLVLFGCNRPSSELKQEARGETSSQSIPVQVSTGLIKSKTEKGRISSKILGYDLQYWVHLPKGYQEGRPYPTLYVTDGFWYKEQGGLLKIADRLLKKEQIKPIIIVLVDAIGPDNRNDNRRELEFLCNPKYIDFYREELVPRVDQSYSTDTSQLNRGILGVSFGGLNSMYFGRYASDLFGKVGIQSPAPHPCPDIYQAYTDSPTLPIDIYLSTGTVNDTAPAAIKLKGILEEKGYKIAYQEVAKGHNWANWKPLLDDVLLHFYSTKSTNIND